MPPWPTVASVLATADAGWRAITAAAVTPPEPEPVDPA